jgi:hypothetical protein
LKIEVHRAIAVGASLVRHIEVESVDWERRVVWLSDGRWVPFENVVVGKPEQRLSEAPRGLAKTQSGIVPAPREAWVCACSRVFSNAQALGAHQRFCKES